MQAFSTLLPDSPPINPEIREHHWTIPADGGGERLDKLLTRLNPEMSRSFIQRLIKEGEVWINGTICLLPKEKVQAGASLRLRLLPAEESSVQPEEIPLTVVYEDHDLIVIDKPAGLSVHPGAGRQEHTLVNALLHHCGSLSSGGSLTGVGGVQRPGIVHRLDMETSGLLVAAKNDLAHRGLAEQFKAHTVSRRYLAIVQGRPRPAEGTVDAPIGRHPKWRQRMAVIPQGHSRQAITHYRIEESLPPFSLLSCRLETGRTHQIRVHMAHIGHPVLGDPVYGHAVALPSTWPGTVRQLVSGFKRQALHAATLGFVHPIRGIKLHFQAEPPADFAELLAALRQMATRP